jgi:DNA polymerase-1
MSRERLFLIDGMSHIYRAYFAIRNLSNSKGLPTNAIFGFTSILRKIIQEQKPDYIVVAIDTMGPTVRHQKFEDYKATRKPMPEDLAQQLPYIQRVCDALRVRVIGVPGYEADDIIGTLADDAVEHGMDVVIVTSDKDMLQLVGEHVLVLDPMKDNLIMDPPKVIEKLGVTPEQVPDLLGLWGDSSDNIPGAPGIGEKGARELIQTYGTVEHCLQNWDKVRKKNHQESLRDHADLIRMSRELATIHRDLPLEVDIKTLALSDPDRKAAFKLFAELEFQSLMREFLDEAKPGPSPAEFLSGSAALQFIAGLHQQKMLHFCLDYSEAPFSRHLAEFACAQAESGRIGVVSLKDPALAQAWGALLQNPGVTKVCWDAKLCRLAQEARHISMNWEVEDVMLMAFLTAPHLGDYSLKRWAMDQLHINLVEEKTAQGLLADSDSDRIASNLARTLNVLRELYNLLGPHLNQMGLTKLYREIELPLLPVLADMERTGIKISPDVLHRLSFEMEKQLSDLTARIYSAAGMEFNINSPKQLGEVLFEKLHLPILKKTRKTGGYSTDQAVLEELALSYEIPRLILDYRQVSKLKSTYVDSLPGLIHPNSGRVHTSFNQTGAATGRLSSSDPNLQNIPVRSDLGRLIRGAFVPEEGNLLLSADYSQVELRILAHLSEDDVLIDAFRKNEDIHDRTAREVFGSIDEEHRAEYRRKAKVINFGIVYGLSAFGMAQRLGIPREEAQAFIDGYFQRYKGVRAWLDKTLEEVRKTGQAQTLFGRLRPIPDIVSKDYAARQFAERTAVNTPIQGTAADVMKIAMIRVHGALHKQQLSAKILLQVHDELVIEVPKNELDTVQELVRGEMQNAASLKVPLLVELSAADNWKDAK